MILIFYSLIMGYLTAKIFSGRCEHEDGLFRSAIFNYKGYSMHLHHWIASILIILIYSSVKIVHLNQQLMDHDRVIIGFFSGICFQGIHDYKDWKEIIKKS